MGRKSLTYDENEEWKNPFDNRVHSGVEDVSIVATHIMLEAQELGLGTCWVNYFDNRELEKIFELPKSERSVLLMPIGYPDQNSVPSILHSTKKDLKDIVKKK